jgi:hypothetical protein
MAENQADFSGWAIVEIFGHQRYAGFVTTAAFGQAVLFRVDVPPLEERERVTKHYGYDDDGKSIPAGSTVKETAVQGYTKYFGPGAIYGMTPCTQAVAEEAVASMQSRKVSVVTLAPLVPERALRASFEDPDGDDPDDDDSDEPDEPTL